MRGQGSEPSRGVRWASGIALALGLSARSARADAGNDARDVEAMLAAQPQRFGSVLASPATFRAQILVSEVAGDGRGAALVRRAYREDAEYFYPASAIKLCAAVAALEKLSELRIVQEENDLLRTTPARFFPLDESAPPFASDPTESERGRATLAHEIRKALIGSDNEAFNRLYSFVGQRELNERMWEHGLASVRIAHRLGYVAAPEEARVAPRVEFLLADGTSVVVPKRVAGVTFEERPIAGLSVGNGYIENGRLVATPMGFATKNRISIRDLQDLLVGVVRPELLPAKARPKLDADDRDHLLDALATLPRESKNPAYDPAQFPDAAQRPVLPGVVRVLPRERLEIAGKSGRAYGFTIENVYVADRATRRAFFLTAVLHTNGDEVLNDDTYEYGFASTFLADLGEAVARRVFRETPANTSADRVSRASP